MGASLHVRSELPCQQRWQRDVRQERACMLGMSLLPTTLAMRCAPRPAGTLARLTVGTRDGHQGTCSEGAASANGKSPPGKPDRWSNDVCAAATWSRSHPQSAARIRGLAPPTTGWRGPIKPHRTLSATASRRPASRGLVSAGAGLDSGRKQLHLRPASAGRAALPLASAGLRQGRGVGFSTLGKAGPL